MKYINLLMICFISNLKVHSFSSNNKPNSYNYSLNEILNKQEKIEANKASNILAKEAIIKE